MTQVRLNIKLLQKVSSKTGKKIKYLREQISKRANRYGITSEAALILWAKELKIGTASYQRSLPPHIQEEIRSKVSLPIVSVATSNKLKIKTRTRPDHTKSFLSSMIGRLIQDKQLLYRCEDLLKASGKFDRVFREATTILDHRIKSISGLRRMHPVDAVGKAINPDPDKAILKVSDERLEQEGFFYICKGLILAFRDTTHHEITDKFSREDALKFCSFIDMVLRTLSQSQKQGVEDGKK